MYECLVVCISFFFLQEMMYVNLKSKISHLFSVPNWDYTEKCWPRDEDGTAICTRELGEQNWPCFLGGRAYSLSHVNHRDTS